MEQRKVNASHPLFGEIVDERVEISRDDPELAEALRWIDGQASSEGVSFYEMTARVLFGDGKSACAWRPDRFRN